ncbi:hypothetical protein M5U04_02695, partial [Xenorhabdus sp. XENO-1]|nr:hypothetical protein [Xenorhabdus bovienii subsp. africana]
MTNKYRLIVKFKKKYLAIKTRTHFTIKDSIINNIYLKNYSFTPALPTSFLRGNINNNIDTTHLIGMYYIRFKTNVDDKKFKKIIEKLTELSFFEYIQVLPEIPPSPPSLLATMNEYNTPDFTHLQHYKYGDQGDYYGIDMEYAWSLGIAGQGI